MAVPAPRRPSRKDARRGRIVLSFFLAIPLLGLITMLSAALFAQYRPALALWGWLVVWRPALRRRGALWKHLWAPLPLN